MGFEIEIMDHEELNILDGDTNTFFRILEKIPPEHSA